MFVLSSFPISGFSDCVTIILLNIFLSLILPINWVISSRSLTRLGYEILARILLGDSVYFQQRHIIYDSHFLLVMLVALD